MYKNWPKKVLKTSIFGGNNATYWNLGHWHFILLYPNFIFTTISTNIFQALNNLQMAFVELSKLPGSKKIDGIPITEKLETVELNTKLSLASWNDNWKSCYFNFSKFHLSISMQDLQSQSSLLNKPVINYFYLDVWPALKISKNEPIFSNSVISLDFYAPIIFLPFPYPINHQVLLVFLELCSQQSSVQQSSWELIRYANSQTLLQTSWIRNSGDGAWQSWFCFFF